MFLRALVPLVGGLSLLVGGMAVLYVDWLDCLADAAEPRPIYIRYTSQATFDLHRRPHWLFVLTTSIFCPCLLATAFWQAALAEAAAAADNADSRLDSDIRLYSIVCAVGGYLVSTLPMGTTLGFLLHMVTAGAFAAGGINYVFRAQQLASDRDETGLATLRAMLAFIGIAAAVLMAFNVHGGGNATDKLTKFRTLKVQQEQNGDNDTTMEDHGDFMTSQDVKKARMQESLLALSQFLVGVIVGVAVLTAVAEVTSDDLDNALDDLEATPVWIVGLTSFAAMVVGAGIFVALNDTLYQWCQAPKEEDDDEDHHDKEKEEKETASPEGDTFDKVADEDAN